ncbi:MAG: outer membrane beta-barrel protein, partial [Anaerolineales bacterium]|nr:outer membrane beta-barrel protein [Anaerolineales bacterium]
KMYTWIGYELVENIGNPNYTHGMVYNNAIPFTHTGISFDVSEFINNDAVGLTLYAVNGWDTYIDNNEGKSFGAYLTWAPNDDFFISLAAIRGPETPMTSGTGAGGTAAIQGNTGFGGMRESDNVGMYDIVITYSLPQVDNLSLGFNWDHGKADANSSGHPALNPDGVTLSARSDAHWWGAVGYAMYDFSDNQMGALRYEYFDDTDGAKAFDISMWSLTYTHNITIADNLMIRPEIRYNSYSQNTAPTATNVLGSLGSLTPGDRGNTADNETVLALGVEYIF